MLVLWLAVLWLPASSHALLEQAGLIHTHQPHSHSHGEADTGAPQDPSGHPNESHDAADGRCLRVLLDAGPLLLVPDLMPSFLAGAMGLGMADLVVRPPSPAPESPGTAPPELTPSWLFLQRTTLPVRAPSPRGVI